MALILFILCLLIPITLLLGIIHTKHKKDLTKQKESLQQQINKDQTNKIERLKRDNKRLFTLIKQLLDRE